MQPLIDLPAEELPPGPALYIVASPIGNLEDVTLRALRVLASVDLILAEDTRKSRQLLQRYKIETALRSYRIHEQETDTTRALHDLRQGRRIALLTDAGTPGLSDPGAALVRRTRDEFPECPITPLPGPSALTAALSVSGWQTNPTLFAGFLPPRSAARRRFFEDHKDFDGVIALYESVHRIRACVGEALSILVNREVLVAREISKRFEDIRRFLPGESAPAFLSGLVEKGEFTVLLGPPGRRKAATPAGDGTGRPFP